MAWLRSDIRQNGLVFFAKLSHGMSTFFSFSKNKPIVIEAYLALNDPHSYLLVQVLPQLEAKYNVRFELRLTYAGWGTDVTCRQAWKKWALNDANAMAELYQLTHIQAYPSPQSLNTGQQAWQLYVKDTASAISVFEKTWTNSWQVNFQPSTPVINRQIKNQIRQSDKGHYAPASLYVAGQWFVGIERLDHLERLLNDWDASIIDPVITDVPSSLFQRRQLRFIPNEINHEENTQELCEQSYLEVFVSIRSPYSYLGLIQAKQLAEHYRVPLKIKPVLPMVMRGLIVPPDKMRYIFWDTVREAKQLGIPFGYFTDPLGKGVMNSYKIFSYAELEGKGLAYIMAILAAVHVNKRNLANTGVIKGICEELAIDYEAAISYDSEHDWQGWVDENQQELSKLSLWGVPCFIYKDTCVWGQDRLWQIEQAILCSRED